MSSPDQAAGMKQRDDLFRGGIDSGEIWTLVTVAAMTRPGKIVEHRLAPVLTGDNVLKVKGSIIKIRYNYTAHGYIEILH
jgi:hypothetical protein